MDKISELLKNVRERLSNPLIFSFLLSWILYNWKVTVGLVWYDTQQLKAIGYGNIYDFIIDNTQSRWSFWFPVIFAVVYTIITPPIKVLISAFSTRMSKWSDNWNIKISEGHKVDMGKYLSLRADYKEKNRALETIIDEESTNKKKVGELEDSMLSERREHSITLTKMGELQTFIGQLRNVSILDGNWIMTYLTMNGGNESHQKIEIRAQELSIININGVRERAFSITHFFYDNRNQEITFSKIAVDSSKAVFFNELKFEHDELTGTENGKRIVYKREQKSILLNREEANEQKKIFAQDSAILKPE